MECQLIRSVNRRSVNWLEVCQLMECHLIRRVSIDGVIKVEDS